MSREETDESKCYETALRILGLRSHSILQLRRKLQRRYEPEVVESTIARLLATGLLNEQSFAEQFVLSRLRRRTGSLRISRELGAAGIESDVSKSALAKVLEEEPEEEHLRVACERRLRILLKRHGLDWLRSATGRNKLIAHLLQQGYSTSDVLRTVAEQVKQAAAEAAESGS